MSDGFKPFLVDLPEDEANLLHVPKGRYLVVAVVGGSDTVNVGRATCGLLATWLVGPNHMTTLPPDKVIFAGFRDDCILCEHVHNPERP